MKWMDELEQTAKSVRPHPDYCGTQCLVCAATYEFMKTCNPDFIRALVEKLRAAEEALKKIAATPCCPYTECNWLSAITDAEWVLEALRKDPSDTK